MRSDSGAVGSAVAELQDAGVRGRIEGTEHHGPRRDGGRVDHHQPAVARGAPWRVFPEVRHRHVETLGLRIRSEEHTFELQSLTNLVCRLLLEKKKKIEQQTTNEKIRRHIRLSAYTPPRHQEET